MKKKTRRSEHKAIHLIAATIFALVTIVHLLRLSYGWPLVIGTWIAPMWLSWIAIFLTGSLAVLLWNTKR